MGRNQARKERGGGGGVGRRGRRGRQRRKREEEWEEGEDEEEEEEEGEREPSVRRNSTGRRCVASADGATEAQEVEWVDW